MKEVDMYESQDSVDCIDNSFELEFEGTVKCPLENWTDRYSPKFEAGEVIVNMTGAIYKVIGSDKYPNTFLAIPTGNDSTRTIDGMDFKKAPKGTTWESFHDTTNPLKVKGLKISCPSNMA